MKSLLYLLKKKMLSMTDIKKTSDRSHSLALILSAFLTVVGCGLLIAGFVVPPSGEIHSSALVAFGEIMTFVAALLGISQHTIATLTKFLANLQKDGKVQGLDS